VVKGIPAEIEKLRDRLLCTYEKDRTGRHSHPHQKCREERIKKVKTELQSSCPHEFLIGYGRYGDPLAGITRIVNLRIANA